MRHDGDFDYAQARLLARHGAHPQTSDWSALAVSRDLGHLLAATQRSPLGWWATTLSADMDAHAIERQLRAAWHGYVAEVSRWLPLPWQPAIDWCGWVPELQLIARLGRDLPAPDWMLLDPVYGPLAPGSPADRAAAMAGGPLAPFRRSVLSEETVGRAWWDHWRRLLPRRRLRPSPGVDELERLGMAFLATAPGSAEAREDALEQFSRGCVRLLRRASDSALGAFGHLGSVAVDGLRLRGLLVSRAVFAAGTEGNP